MLRDRAKKALQKKARKGFKGYPAASVAFYGPTDRLATKMVVGILPSEFAPAEPMRKWYRDHDLRQDAAALAEALAFIGENGALGSVIMPERIIGCPHEEGTDYPEGEHCPSCTFWVGRNRFAGL
ncbi:hypothetical protein [Stutzerimonas tarimensis]|uniref:Uncharacterized protein n=1 Tax=Stutzerimonas tarimensis TaxID=1507735 RepID=A0ABV7T3V3_9GAMM